MVNESRIRQIIKALMESIFVPLKFGIIDNVNIVICFMCLKVIGEHD
jgi:hypothetical protein